MYIGLPEQRPLVRLLKLILANLKKGNWFEYFGAKNQFGFLNATKPPFQI
jgi:hypothetical protein